MKIVLNPKFDYLKTLVDNIEIHFQASSEILYDQRNQIRVVAYEGEDYVVKSFKIPNVPNRLVYRYFRPSKAKRSYEYSRKIGKQFCPEAVAYIEKYDSFFLAESYYISKRYDYDFTIRPVLLDEGFDKNKRNKILIGLAEFAYVLHENNIQHNDFSYGNILIKVLNCNDDGPMKQFQFKIIDVNRMQFKKLTLSDRLNNFARLSADDEAMEIMMRAYSKCINKPLGDILPKSKFFRDEFIRKRVLKNKLRGR